MSTNIRRAEHNNNEHHHWRQTHIILKISKLDRSLFHNVFTLPFIIYYISFVFCNISTLTEGKRYSRTRIHLTKQSTKQMKQRLKFLLKALRWYAKWTMCRAFAMKTNVCEGQRQKRKARNKQFLLENLMWKCVWSLLMFICWVHVFFSFNFLKVFVFEFSPILRILWTNIGEDFSL